MPFFICPRRHYLALLAICLFNSAGCASLPDTQTILARHTQQQARFESALGPVSAKRQASVLAGLKRGSGDIDILDKHIALEQAIVGSPLVLGNKTRLLQDGPATYAAMFALSLIHI